MKFDTKTIALALTLALGTSQSWAAHEFLDGRIVFSGFGSLGGVRSDTDEGEFRRDDQISGAASDVAFDVDSNLGLQLTANATDWLSATVQSLTMQRNQGQMSTQIEWAYLKLNPTRSLSVLAGRMTLPMFLVSDSRNVGYANTWLRPPNEVYGMAMLHRLEGANITYAVPIKGTTLTASVIGGKSSLHIANFDDNSDVDRVKGGNLQWESDWLTLRVGRVQGRVVEVNDIYEFSGVGAIYDRNNLLLQGEFVTRRSKRGFSEGVDADGWYTLAGYRIDKFLPFVSYASTKPKYASLFHLSETQSTIAAGLRWDAFGSSAIKLQVERIDTQDSSGISFTTPMLPAAGMAPQTFAPITKPVTVVSLAVDVVF